MDESHGGIRHGLLQASAYPHSIESKIEVHETHISWIFLTGKYAYKVKKPVRNSFLDYSSLDRRRECCHEELRLDSRYAEELYVGVVPITRDENGFHVDGDGKPIEFAVKMLQFPDNALLSNELALREVRKADIEELAGSIAEFHAAAPTVDPNSEFARPHVIFHDAIENFDIVETALLEPKEKSKLKELRSWTEAEFKLHADRFAMRRREGYVRECHGDLHSGNIVRWRQKLIPFDGIEFNPAFRWIDLLSDLAFLSMDLRKHGRDDLAAILLDVCLASTGDFESLQILPWYEIYRAMVRAKVAALTLEQCETEGSLSETQQELGEWLELGMNIKLHRPLRLAITHGFSASGKSTGSSRWLQKHRAIRLRSDVERKRMLGKPITYRPSREEMSTMYSSDMTERVYSRLLQLAETILQAGLPVVVDATFLKHQQRRLFQSLAERLGIEFEILEFQASPADLRRRIRKRAEKGGDPSDADEATLDRQMLTAEALESAEMPFVRSLR